MKCPNCTGPFLGRHPDLAPLDGLLRQWEKKSPPRAWKAWTQQARRRWRASGGRPEGAQSMMACYHCGYIEADCPGCGYKFDLSGELGERIRNDLAPVYCPSCARPLLDPGDRRDFPVSGWSAGLPFDYFSQRYRKRSADTEPSPLPVRIDGEEMIRDGDTLYVDLNGHGPSQFDLHVRNTAAPTRGTNLLLDPNLLRFETELPSGETAFHLTSARLRGPGEYIEARIELGPADLAHLEAEGGADATLAIELGPESKRQRALSEQLRIEPLRARLVARFSYPGPTGDHVEEVEWGGESAVPWPEEESEPPFVLELQLLDAKGGLLPFDAEQLEGSVVDADRPSCTYLTLESGGIQGGRGRLSGLAREPLSGRARVRVVLRLKRQGYGCTLRFDGGVLQRLPTPRFKLFWSPDAGLALARRVPRNEGIPVLGPVTPGRSLLLHLQPEQEVEVTAVDGPAELLAPTAGVHRFRIDLSRLAGSRQELAILVRGSGWHYIPFQLAFDEFYEDRARLVVDAHRNVLGGVSQVISGGGHIVIDAVGADYRRYPVLNCKLDLAPALPPQAIVRSISIVPQGHEIPLGLTVEGAVELEDGSWRNRENAGHDDPLRLTLDLGATMKRADQLTEEGDFDGLHARYALRVEIHQASQPLTLPFELSIFTATPIATRPRMDRGWHLPWLSGQHRAVDEPLWNALDLAGYPIPRLFHRGRVTYLPLWIDNRTSDRSVTITPLLDGGAPPWCVVLGVDMRRLQTLRWLEESVVEQLGVIAPMEATPLGPGETLEVTIAVQPPEDQTGVEGGLRALQFSVDEGLRYTFPLEFYAEALTDPPDSADIAIDLGTSHDAGVLVMGREPEVVRWGPGHDESSCFVSADTLVALGTRDNEDRNDPTGRSLLNFYGDLAHARGMDRTTGEFESLVTGAKGRFTVSNDSTSRVVTRDGRNLSQDARHQIARGIIARDPKAPAPGFEMAINNQDILEGRLLHHLEFVERELHVPVRNLGMTFPTLYTRDSLTSFREMANRALQRLARRRLLTRFPFLRESEAEALARLYCDPADPATRFDGQEARARARHLLEKVNTDRRGRLDILLFLTERVRTRLDTRLDEAAAVALARLAQVPLLAGGKDGWDGLAHQPWTSNVLVLDVGGGTFDCSLFDVRFGWAEGVTPGEHGSSPVLSVNRLSATGSMYAGDYASRAARMLVRDALYHALFETGLARLGLISTSTDGEGLSSPASATAAGEEVTDDFMAFIGGDSPAAAASAPPTGGVDLDATLDDLADRRERALAGSAWRIPADDRFVDNLRILRRVGDALKIRLSDLEGAYLELRDLPESSDWRELLGLKLLRRDDDTASSTVGERLRDRLGDRAASWDDATLAEYLGANVLFFRRDYATRVRPGYADTLKRVFRSLNDALEGDPIGPHNLLSRFPSLKVIFSGLGSLDPVLRETFVVGLGIEDRPDVIDLLDRDERKYAVSKGLWVLLKKPGDPAGLRYDVDIEESWRLAVHSVGQVPDYNGTGTTPGSLSAPLIRRGQRIIAHDLQNPLDPPWRPSAEIPFTIPPQDDVQGQSRFLALYTRLDRASAAVDLRKRIETSRDRVNLRYEEAVGRTVPDNAPIEGVFQVWVDDRRRLWGRWACPALGVHGSTEEFTHYPRGWEPDRWETALYDPEED